MKIGVANLLLSYEVTLPSEIIAAILVYVCACEKHRLRTLWACCILSKEWYKAAISLLYERPILTNRNFDLFARTICPPVNAHVRRVGLEHLIQQLDMGRLAYESTNSLTARLLRRTKTSLEVFVAPAASFSISSLAPLSKCSKLRVLDLSHDFYDILLGQLLNAIKHLPLRSLSLPRSAMRRPFSLKPQSLNHQTWPMTLTHLGINDCLPSNVDRWHELFESFPPSLNSLTFDDCSGWQGFWFFPYLQVSASNITCVRITVRREDGGFPISLLLKAFPSVSSITMPTPFLGTDQQTTTSMSAEIDGLELQRLQQLKFTRLPDAVRQVPQLTVAFLADCVKSFVGLRRIAVPDTYIQIGENESEELEKIEEIMSLRANDGEDSGVYLRHFD